MDGLEALCTIYHQIREQPSTAQYNVYASYGTEVYKTLLPPVLLPLTWRYTRAKFARQIL